MADEVKPLIDHLFRREAGKLVSVLTKIFGPHNLELAEDVVQDTLLKALEHWKFHGMPENPSAWLFTVARNKALDVIRRDRHRKDFAAEITPLLKSEYTLSPTLQQLFSGHVIEDEQLRMMFVCCHPSIQGDSQVALILKTLCGFSVGEIAHAFLTREETITKRLYRARQQFRDEKTPFVLPAPAELDDRLDNVLMAVYLIFSEGYNSSHHDSPIREDLVEEALRLGKMLGDHPLTRTADSLALLSLMCFQSARLYGRVDESGQLLQLKDQDRNKWSPEMIQQGIHFLQEASQGERISPYHLEAAIAHEHCIAKSYSETDWKKILSLYDWLMKIKPEPVIALNRLIILAELNGPAQAMEELLSFPNIDSLRHYYLYPAVLGDWNARLGHSEKAKAYFELAMQLTHSPAEKQLLKIKITRLG